MISTRARQSSFLSRLGIALVLALSADFLLFDQTPGISVFIFAALLAAAIILVHRFPGGQKALLAKCVALLIGLVPLIENVSELSISIALLSLAAFALAMAGRLRARLLPIVEQIFGFLLVTPIRLGWDLRRWRLAARRVGGGTVKLVSLIVWLMPLILSAVFIALFGVANPVIEHWLSLIDFWALLNRIEIARILFWIVVIVVTWAFLRPRLRRRARRSTWLPVSRQTTTIEDIVFGKAAILRALILFNAIFAIQTLLDGAYLWGGVALPAGVTYASYAHSGAYPLIATALLAALFVLIAMRPGSATSADGRIRMLVYAWIAQNVVLVISSILRLDLYVSIYSLTYWRVSAFIWMALVATGLMLIMARIAFEKSSEWLCSANFLTLFATLYLCCFVNFGALIASYNIQHSRELGGEGQQLDIYYLRSLGREAVPSIDRVFAEGRLTTGNSSPILRQQLYELVMRYDESNANWRGWTFRNWRLSRYLERNPFAPATQDAASNER